VYLPGADGSPVEVGSGKHHLSAPYQGSQKVRQPLSLDSSIRDVIDDPDAWSAVLKTMLRYVPEFKGVEGNADLPVRQAFAFLGFQPNGGEVFAAIEAALDGSA
jgi:hypothetical protein